MLRIGVLKQEYGGRRPPVPFPRKNGEREKKEIASQLHPTSALRADPPPPKGAKEQTNVQTQGSHFRRAVSRRGADLQGSRHRGRFPAQSRQGQGEARRDHRQLRWP